MALRKYIELILDGYDFIDSSNLYALSMIGYDMLIPNAIWEEANRVDNLVTLCSKHHAIWERTPLNKLKDVAVINGEYRFCRKSHNL